MIGERFNNLGMLTTLLASSKKVDVTSIGDSPKIEVIPDATGNSNDGDVFEVQETKFDWTEKGTCTYEDETSITEGLQSYGFTGHHSGVFMKLKDEMPSIVDVPDPDHMTIHERRLARIACEQTSFNSDHYFADLFDDEDIQVVLKFNPPWDMCQDGVAFTESEKLFMKDLPNKEYLVDHDRARSLYLGLVDLMYAFAYDYRINEGEASVESAWNICKLSSTLSWFEVFSTNIYDVLYTNMRRSLCFPLYRHWKLAELVKDDTKAIFNQGKTKVLQCLFEIHKIFNSTEPYYILNNLYLTDYCVWVQKSHPSIFNSLAQEIEQVIVEKSSVEFELTELEEAAHLVLEDENDGSSIESGESETSEDEEESITEEESDEETDKDSSIKEDQQCTDNIKLLCSQFENVNTND